MPTSPSSDPVARALVTHGLNTHPQVMDELIAALSAAGVRCRRVDLHPPDGSGRESTEQVRRRWLATLSQAHEELAAETPTRPVHAVGYSLGAVLGLAHVASTGASFDRMVLLAPPLALTPTAASVRLLAPLATTGLALPSAAPRSLRHRSWTPLSHYAALLTLVAGLQDLPDAGRLGRIPTRVLLDPGDELVSAAGVRRWVARHDLPAWQVDLVCERPRTLRADRHLIVTEQALGPRAWARVRRATVEHLVGPGPAVTG